MSRFGYHLKGSMHAKYKVSIPIYFKTEKLRPRLKFSLFFQFGFVFFFNKKKKNRGTVPESESEPGKKNKQQKKKKNNNKYKEKNRNPNYMPRTEFHPMGITMILQNLFPIYFQSNNIFFSTCGTGAIMEK